MAKITPTQEKLEVQKKKEIRQIIQDALEKHRGRKNMVHAAAIDLGITGGTIGRWCRELDIDLEEYHKPAPTEKNGQE